MRTHVLLLLPLLAAPLAAQQKTIGPAPSPLFVQQVAMADTVIPHAKMAPWEGSLIGGLTGFLVGLGLARVVEAQSPCGCDDPGLDRAVTYGLSGIVLGAILGRVLLSE